jgi:hypothetical protein
MVATGPTAFNSRALEASKFVALTFALTADNIAIDTKGSATARVSRTVNDA